MNKYDCFLALKTLNEWANEWEEVKSLKDKLHLYGRIILEILKQVDIKAIHLDRYFMDVLRDNGLLPLQKEFIECPHCHEQIHTVPWHIVKQCPYCKKDIPLDCIYENC